MRVKRNTTNKGRLLILLGLVLVLLLAAWLLFGKKNKEEPTADQTAKEDQQVQQQEPAPTPEKPKETQVKEEPKKEIIPTQKKDDPLLILVNKENEIPADYDFDLVSVWGEYEGDSRAKKPLNDMIDGAQEDGITLILCSAYRTKTTSERLYKQEIETFVNKGYSQKEAETEAARWVAPPGTSEHHTGLAFDIVTPSYQTLDHDFSYTEAAKWMKEHCAEYGFVLRFPEDKQEETGITFEPWHFRYVGVEHAKAMTEQGLCLEEYVKE